MGWSSGFGCVVLWAALVGPFFCVFFGLVGIWGWLVSLGDFWVKWSVGWVDL